MYRADIDGMILWFPNFQFVWSPDNYNVHRSGWDMSTQLTFPKPGLFARATISAVSADYAGPVARRAGRLPAPRHRLDLRRHQRVAGVTANLTTLYAGDRRTVQGSALNSLAPYWLTNAQATVRIANGPWPLDALLGVDDLLDDPRRSALRLPVPRPHAAARTPHPPRLHRLIAASTSAPPPPPLTARRTPCSASARSTDPLCSHSSWPSPHARR